MSMAALPRPDADPPPVDPAAAVARAIDAGLAAPGMMDAARFAAFLDAQVRVGLTHGPRPLCRYLRPLVISEQTYGAIARASGDIAAALERVAARALVDPAVADQLGLTADERALAAIDPGYPQALALGRFDMMLNEETRHFHFIELNADSPAGLADQLLVEKTLMALPHVQEVCRRAPVRTPAPHRAILDVLRQIYTAWGGRASRPAIAIVDWTGADTAAELRVLAEIFTAEGHLARIADPGEFRYDGRHLTADGLPIDLVYRRVIVHELLTRGGLDHPLIRAYRDGAVCVANSFRTKAFNKKAAFAVLSDPTFADLFTPAQRAAIAAHIPWTRRVGPDLLEVLRTHPEDFVLKPNDEYGGKGVILGWRATPAEWERALAEWDTSPLIAQARCPPTTTRMPTFDAQGNAPGQIAHEDVYFDLCPFLFAGRMEGAMVRLSRGPVSNVSAGGGVSGLLIVDTRIDARIDGAAPGGMASARAEPPDV
jgi:hypothetical protein